MSRVVQSSAVPPEAGVEVDTESDEESEDEVPALEAWESDDRMDFKPGLQWWQASFSFVVVVIGVGVMALPILPKKGGWYCSVFAMLLCCGAITESGIALWKGIMAGNKGHNMAERDGNKICKTASKAVVISSFEDFGREALGSAGETFVAIVMLLYFIGISASFVTLIVGALRSVFVGVMSTDMWILAISPGLVALALLPNLTAVANFVPIVVACIIALISTMIIKSACDSQRWQEWPDLDASQLHRVMPTTAMSMGTVVATLFGAFGVNAHVPAMLGEMDDPLEFPFAFRMAMMIGFGIFLCVMCCGYYGYGEFMRSDILDSMASFPANQAEAFNTPFGEWTGPKARGLGIVCNSLLLAKLIIGFALNIQNVFYSFQTFRLTKSYVPPGGIANKVMRVCTVATLVSITLLIDDFDKLFALVSSVFGTLLQVFLPLFLSYKLRVKVGARMSGCRRRSVHFVILLVGTFSMTVGFYRAVRDIVDDPQSDTD
mmetsp:Transcript_70963/g.186061  ORF Transcript_70963/g.186061 Transcript_70963/m.186061 type:complete len:491 (-) Transcript_70963:20-1492(-)